MSVCCVVFTICKEGVQPLLFSLPLEDAAGTHTRANAHRHNAESLLGTLKFVHQGADHAAASHAKRVAKRDGTTLRVQLCLGDTELLNAVGCLGSERLIDLKDVNIVDGEAAVLESSRDSVCGADSHNLRGHTSDREANDAAVDSATEARCDVSPGKEDARSAISHLGRVSSSRGTVLLEGRLKLGEALKSRLRSDTVVLVDHHLCLITIFVLDDGLVGRNLSLEITGLLGGGSLLVALDGKGVLLGAAHTELSGNVLRSDSHWHQAVAGRLVLKDLLSKQVRVDLVGHVGVGHRLESTTDADGDLAGADRVRDRGHGLQARGAQAVDARNAGGIRVASHEHGHTSVGRSGARVEHVSNDNILDECLVDAGLLSNSFEAGLEHGLETSVSLGTSLCAGHCRARHSNDHDIVVSLRAHTATIVTCVLCEVLVNLVESLHDFAALSAKV